MLVKWLAREISSGTGKHHYVVDLGPLSVLSDKHVKVQNMEKFTHKFLEFVICSSLVTSTTFY